MANKYSGRFRIGFILLLFLILFVRIRFGVSVGSDDPVPEGEWVIAYHYANDSSLIYTGDMKITAEDSLILTIAVKPPLSKRTENLKVEELSFDKGKVTGKLIHNTYLIKGGFLTESFELIFTDDDSLHGSGKCLNHCAEGTQGMGIIWTGQRKTANL